MFVTRYISQRLRALGGCFIIVVFACVSACIAAPYAQAATTQDPTHNRYGYFWTSTAPNGRPLNIALAGQWWDSDGYSHYCVQALRVTASPSDATVNAGAIPAPTVVNEGYAVSDRQMAWLLERYGSDRNASTQASLSLLVHANFEQPETAKNLNTFGFNSTQEVSAWLVHQAEIEVPDVAQRARDMVIQAHASVAGSFANGHVVGERQRRGTYEGFVVRTETTNMPVEGVAVTATLSGPAIWEESGTNTLTLTSTTQPQTKNWIATGNGRVSLTLSSIDYVGGLTRFERTGSQSTLKRVDKESVITGADIAWDVFVDFRPTGVSHVQKVTSSGEFTDSFDAMADSSYGSGQWMSQVDVLGTGEGYVPVTYTARAYKVKGGELPQRSSEVPSDALIVGTQKVVASGPGAITASFSAENPGWYVVVWSVEAHEQEAQWADAIKAGWADDWAVPDETASYTYKMNIDTALGMRTTKNGHYLVDDVWISGLPKNHPNFAGGYGFAPDAQEITHKVLFFPSGEAVTDANRDAGVQIGDSVQIPASNGFYPSVGDTSWHVQTDSEGNAVPGTYVFVSEFVGDDRVDPLVTSVEDATEQFVVAAEPTIHTTLTHGGGRVPVSSQGTVELVDVVTYTNLTPSMSYNILGTLMDKSTGEPLKDADGNPLTSQVSFTPDSPNGTVLVPFVVDASLFSGVTTVAFETLTPARGEPVVHADLNDDNQTLVFETHAPPPPRSDKAPRALSKTGVALPAVGAMAGAFVAGGLGVRRIKKRWNR